MDYLQLKELAGRADRAKGKERERLVEALLSELPRLDPFEGFSEGAVWLAKFLASLKWFNANDFS